MPKFSVKPRLDSPDRTIVLGEVRQGDTALIGELAELGPRTRVFLSMDYEHVIGIFGKRGSGKSHLLGSLLEAIAWRELDPEIASIRTERGAILFDVLNIFQWVSEKNDVPVGVELFHVPGFAPPTVSSTELLLRPFDLNSEDWCILLGIDGIREPMGQVLTEAVMLAKRQNVDSIDGLINVINRLASRFAPETIRAVTQRLSSYASLGLFSSSGPPLSILCKPKSASIILFAGVPEDVRSLFIFLIIRRVYEERVRSSQFEKAAQLGVAVAAAGVLPTTPWMWLFIDEAQNIVPTRQSSYAIDMLVRYVREGRNYGLSLCFTTQQPGSIDARIMSQIDTLVSFVLTTPADIAAVTRNLKSALPRDISLAGHALTFEEALRALDVGKCMISNIDAGRLAFMEARERQTLHGGFEP